MSECDGRIYNAACELDQGHVGPHTNFAIGVAWHSIAGPLGYVCKHPDLWKVLEALQRADWTDGELSYLRNMVEEQPEREAALGEERRRRR